MVFWGNQIRRCRRLQGLTQAALAEKLGVEQATVSRWERGVHEPDLRLHRRLRDLLFSASSQSDEVLFHRISCSPFAVKISDRHAKNMAASVPAAAVHGVSQSQLAVCNYQPFFSELLSKHWKLAIEAGFFEGNIASVLVYNDWRPAGGEEPAHADATRYCKSTWTPATLCDHRIVLISEFVEIDSLEFRAISPARRFSVTTLDDLIAR